MDSFTACFVREKSDDPVSPVGDQRHGRGDAIDQRSSLGNPVDDRPGACCASQEAGPGLDAAMVAINREVARTAAMCRSVERTVLLSQAFAVPLA